MILSSQLFVEFYATMSTNKQIKLLNENSFKEILYNKTFENVFKKKKCFRPFSAFHSRLQLSAFGPERADIHFEGLERPKCRSKVSSQRLGQVGKVKNS
jgi:hypothetical protein